MTVGHFIQQIFRICYNTSSEYLKIVIVLFIIVLWVIQFGINLNEIIHIFGKKV